jgi:adenylate cyclase
MMATAALQTVGEEPMSVPGKSPLVQGRGLDEGTGMRRRLAAILAADVAGYSRLMQADEAGTHAAFKGHLKELFEPEIARHEGRVVKTTGDGLLAEFVSTVEALACALEVQRAMLARNAGTPENRQLHFRIGINLGEIIVEEHDVFGDGVNVAARLESLAEPSGICLSGDVYRYVRGKIDVRFEDLGDQALKNMPEPVRVFRVVPPADRVRAAPPDVVEAGRGLPMAPWIAVLPLDNLSGEADQGYFSDGITNDLINDLSRFPELSVIASHTAFAYKGKAIKIETVARELGVRYVVEGSVQRAGGMVRINVQLVDGGTGRHLWGERYKRDLQDLFAVQDEIAHGIVATVASQVAVYERERSLRKPAESLEAYDYYLRGQAIWYDWTSESNRRAHGYFRQAIKLDPAFARAYGGMSYILIQQAIGGWAPDPEAALAEARAFARQAVALAPTDFEAYECLGLASLYGRDFGRCIACYEKAFELNPNSADLLADMADALAHVGRTQEAVAMIAQAKRLNPIHPDWYEWVLGIAAYHDGRYEEALAALTRISNMATYMRRDLAATYVRLGRLEEARAVARQILAERPSYRLSAEAIEPFKDPEVLRAFVADLRRAGLPD